MLKRCLLMKLVGLVTLCLLSISLSAKECAPVIHNAFDLVDDQSLNEYDRMHIRRDVLCNINTEIYFSPKLTERGLSLHIIDNEFRFLEKLKRAHETKVYSEFSELIHAKSFNTLFFEYMKGINVSIKVGDPSLVDDFVNYQRDKVCLNSACGQVYYLSDIYYVNTCADESYGLMLGQKVPTRTTTNGWGLKNIPFNYCHNMILPAYNNVYTNGVFSSSYMETFDWMDKGASNVMDLAKFQIDRINRDERIRLKRKELDGMVDFGEISDKEAAHLFDQMLIQMSDEYYQLLLKVDSLFENSLDLLDKKGITYSFKDS